MRKVMNAAAAATILLAGGVVRVQAADMSLPPAYQDSDSLVEFGSGWYLRGDLNYVTINRPSYGYNSQATATLPSAAPGVLIGDPMSQQGIFGATVGVGYAFNKWFRSDVTYDWRENLSGSFNQTSTSWTKIDQTQIQSWSALANVYGDLGTWFNLTPYVGGGIGLSNIKVSTNEKWFSSGVPFNPAGVVFSTAPIYTNFAFALMAGLAYDVSSHVKLDVGYRYLNLGSVNVVDSSGNVVRRTLDTQEVRAGLRWTPDL